MGGLCAARPEGAAWGARLQRPPQEFDPEAVLLHSGLDAGTVAAFLHENYVHFVADTAISDAADILGYFSDAGAHSCAQAEGPPTPFVLFPNVHQHTFPLLSEERGGDAVTLCGNHVKAKGFATEVWENALHLQRC